MHRPPNPPLHYPCPTFSKLLGGYKLMCFEPGGTEAYTPRFCFHNRRRLHHQSRTVTATRRRSKDAEVPFAFVQQTPSRQLQMSSVAVQACTWPGGFEADPRILTRSAVVAIRFSKKKKRREQTAVDLPSSTWWNNCGGSMPGIFTYKQEEGVLCSLGLHHDDRSGLLSSTGSTLRLSPSEARRWSSSILYHRVC